MVYYLFKCLGLCATKFIILSFVSSAILNISDILDDNLLNFIAISPISLIFGEQFSVFRLVQ